MNKQIFSAISAANVTALAGFLMALLEKYQYNQSDLLIEVFIVAIVFWVIGFVFSLLLLLFLTPVFIATSNNTSLGIFLGVGFGVPFFLGYIACSISVHGNPSSIESNFNQAIMLILSYSFTGMIAAFFSWKSMRKRAENEST